MQEFRTGDASPGLLAGKIEGISVPDLLWAFSRLRKTGTLRVTRNAVRKTIYFQEGQVVFAASSDPDDRLGELLLRERLVTLAQLEDALTRLSLGKRIGTILVEAGYLEPEQLVRGVLLQVRTIITDLFSWEDGEYEFEEGSLPTVEVITLGTHTGDIVLEGIRKLRSFSRIRRGVGPVRTWFQVHPEAGPVLENLTLSEGERMLLEQLEGNGDSVERLCAEVFLSNFEIYQALWALKILGVVQEIDRIGGDFSGEVIEGRFGGESVAPLLTRLCRSRETGVLTLIHGEVERTLHIKEGRCVFATSNSTDDGLMAYLLRRGVISLKDRDEAARRLLSNKRVGTILLEMGVLDQEDLRTMVQEHLREIVHGSLRWEEGEFSFLSGELPTIEEIVLEDTVEQLVRDGLAGIQSWSRVREGLGGIDRELQLTPGFLEVLDRMSIGPEEWDVISALKSPATAMDVCEATGLGDFKVCQILWTLRILGAAAQSPEVVEEEPVPAECQDAVEDFSEPEEAVVDGALVEPDRTVEAEGTIEQDSMDRIAETDDSQETVRMAEPPEPAEEEAWGAVEDLAEEEDESPSLPTGDAVEDLAAALEETTPPIDDLGTSGEEPGPVPFDSGRTMAISRELLEEALSKDSEDARIPVELVETEETTPPLDSPMDATVYIPRDEIALGSEDEDGTGEGGEAAEYQLDYPVAPDPEEPVEEPEEETNAAVPVETAPALDAEISEDEAEDRSERREAAEGGLLAETEIDAVPRPEVEADIEQVPDAHSGLPQEDEPEVESEADPEEDAEVDMQAEPETEPVPETELGAEPEAEEGDLYGSEPEEDWEPPSDLERQISVFNAGQRIVYRTLRAEVGAGAANFIRSCCGNQDEEVVALFARSEIQSDGTWDEEGLRKGVLEARDPDPGPKYRALLDQELEMLKVQIGEARCLALQDQVDALLQSR